MHTPALTSLAAAALHPDAKTFEMFKSACREQDTSDISSRRSKELEDLYL